MPTPRKPGQPPEASSRPILVIALLALLLIGGWVWTQYSHESAPETTSESIAPIDSLATETVRDTAQQDITETMPTLPADLVKEEIVKKAKTPSAEPQSVRPSATEKPTESVKPTDSVAKTVELPKSVEKTTKPAPVPCDQLVLRSGDLIDVVISEIGVNEIRYKRCRWKDGPNYVVAKADVLSIHFANGDVERF